MQIFNLDSPVMRFLTKAADLMILNLLFLICCLPIVTIGAATTALYSVTLKMVKNEESYVAKGFFSAFKSNFKISTVLWILTVLAGIIIYVDYYVSPSLPSPFNQIMLFLITVLLVFYLITWLYLFPYIARFENSWKNTIKNAFMIGMANLPFTLLLVLFVGILVFLSLYINFAIVGLVWILCGFSIAAYAMSFIFRRIFTKYEGPENTEDS